MAEILWSPSEQKRKSSLIQKFIEESSLNFDNYFDLHDWSVNNIEDFWSKFWDFSGIVYSKTYDSVLTNPTMPEKSQNLPQNSSILFTDHLWRSK